MIYTLIAVGLLHNSLRKYNKMNNAVSCLFGEMLFILKTHVTYRYHTAALFGMVVLTMPLQLPTSHSLRFV